MSGALGPQGSMRLGIHPSGAPGLAAGGIQHGTALTAPPGIPLKEARRGGALGRNREGRRDLPGWGRSFPTQGMARDRESRILDREVSWHLSSKGSRSCTVSTTEIYFHAI